MPTVWLGDDPISDLIYGRQQTGVPMTISNKDIWITASSLIAHHGDNAEVRAVAHHQSMLERGDREGMALWNRVRRAVIMFVSFGA